MPKRRPYTIPQLTGGLNLAADPLLLQDHESPNNQLCRFHKGVLKKDWALSAVDGVDERVMHFARYKQFDGDEYNICCTVDHAYRFDGATSAWTNISGGTPTFTGDEDDIFFSCAFNDLFIVTNGLDPVRKWNGTTWASLGGSPPSAAKYLIPFYSRLVLANTVESGVAYPLRVRWSVIGNPETWSGAGSGAIDILDTQDPITGLATLGDRLFVFKEDSIWELYYIGGTDIFRVRLISKDVGCRCGKTIANVGTYLVFVGSNNVYLFDGSTFESIGDPMIPLIYETSSRLVDHSVLYRAHAIFDYEDGQYIVALPTVDDPTPNLVLKYDLAHKVWTRRTQRCTALGHMAGTIGGGSGATWSSAAGTWTGGAWDSPWRTTTVSVGMPSVLYGEPDGGVRKDMKTAQDSGALTWETKDFRFSTAHRFFSVRYHIKSRSFTVQYSLDGGGTWTDPKTLSGGDSFKTVIDHLNFTSPTLRVRVRSGSDDFELKWIEPWYIDRRRPGDVLGIQESAPSSGSVERTTVSGSTRTTVDGATREIL